MILWAILTAMTAAVAVAISIPLIRRYEAGRSDRDLLVAVARDQVAELSSEVSLGTLTPAEAAEGRAEIDRRVLSAVKSSEGPGQVVPERRRMMGVIALSGWVVAGATGLYAVLGQPDLPAVSRTPTEVAAVETDSGVAAETPEVPGAGSVEEMINGLVTRLAENPEDAEGWRMLGWSYFQTERYAEAAKAYGEAVKRDGSRPEVWSAYGEVLVRTAKGMVSEEAIAAFDHALAIDPKDPRAHFFKGMALEQAGDATAAVEAWVKLVEGAEKGADWLPGVIERIDELSTAQGIDIGSRIDPWRPLAALPSTDAAPNNPGPTAEDVAAAQDMLPEDRAAMIEGMVAKLDARLSENPDDPEGWVKLINSRMVLKQPEAAADALARARTALAASPDKLQMVEDGAAAAGLSGN
jgi:cytochrome c-type biogenesis protein CcmH